jgi:hypothetical protein
MKRIVLPLSTLGIFVFIAVVSVGTSSCEKEQLFVHDTTKVTVHDTIVKHDTLECPTPTYPVTGLWEGTYTTNQVSHPPAYASMMIFPDGTMMKRNKVVGTANEYALTRGRWTLTGNTFQYRDTTILYSGGTVIETGTLTFKNDGTFSNGTWQNISGQTYTGSFQNMKRIN